MFRRRPLRRPLRPFRQRPRTRVPRALILANQAFETGHYEEAAKRFGALAAAAEARGGPRAPQFFFQAGRANLLAGQIEAGMDQLEHGLALLEAQSDLERLSLAGERIRAELVQRGMTAEANRITAWLGSHLPGGITPSPSGSTRKPLLPTHCPSCGGALHSNEVDWLDDATAECAYCGSPVRAEA